MSGSRKADKRMSLVEEMRVRGHSALSSAVCQALYLMPGIKGRIQ